jgi:preprotein translocase subunit SecA
MVTKAIERAQNTVEARNAEIRKNVLKYDEVMNEQRKVIYRRRAQILDGGDLREQVMETLGEVLESLVQTFCSTDYQEEWDTDGLVAELSAYYPTKFRPDELLQANRSDEVYESVLAEAVDYYTTREAELGPETMREIERRVMLSVIDQRWREHLFEMDYLQEGINLRAMGQQDPLVAWQHEGYEMFKQMVAAIDDEFLKYVMHLEVVTDEPEAPEIRNVQYSAPEDPSVSGQQMQQAAAMHAAEMGEEAAPFAEEVATQAPIVKTDWEKTPRNAPCPCGSGKKFKFCHGSA